MTYPLLTNPVSGCDVSESMRMTAPSRVQNWNSLEDFGGDATMRIRKHWKAKPPGSSNVPYPSMYLVSELVSADVWVGMPLTYVVSTTTLLLWLDWVLKVTGKLTHSSAGVICWYHSVVAEASLALPSRVNA